MTVRNGNIDITGKAELDKAFQGLRDAARQEILEDAVMTGSQPILDRMQELIAYKTGTARRSLHTEIEDSGYDFAEAVTGTDVEYAFRLEFGFEDTDSKGREYHQAAQPFARPAYDEKIAEAQKIAGDVFVAQIQKVVKS